jgi:tetratricopeptide (TPR) repeat protein
LCPKCNRVMDATIGLCATCGYGRKLEAAAPAEAGTAKPTEVPDDLLSFDPPLDTDKGRASLQPKPVVLEFRASAEAVAAILAEAYRTAALNIADMPRVTEALEIMRRALLSETDAIELWDTLDDQLGRAELKRAVPALAQVRDWFRQTLAKEQVKRLWRSFEGDREAGWHDWLTAYAEATAYWLGPLCRVLVGEPFRFPASAETAVDFKHLDEMVVQERWAEAYPLFEYLMQLDFLHPIVRARLEGNAAQIQFLQLLKPKVALQLLRGALEQAPNHYEVYGTLGQYWIDQNDFRRAERYLRRTMDMAPNRAVGYVYMGDLKEKQGELEAAMEWYRESIDRDASDYAGYIRLLRLYGRPELFSSNRDSIPRLAERAISMEPEEEASISREVARTYQSGSEYEEAHRWYEKAIDRQPQCPGAYVDRGNAYIEQGNWDAAQQSFEHAIQIADEAVDGYLGMAWLAERQERWEDALSWYRQVLRRRPQWEVNMCPKIAELHLRLGQRDQAEASLLQALELEPDNSSLQTQLANLADDNYETQKDPAAAQRVYDELLQVVGDKYRPTYHQQIGRMHYWRGEYQEAIDAYKKAIEAAPNGAVYYSDLGDAYLKLQAWEEARAAYQQASRLAPDDPQYLRAKGRAYNEEANVYYSAGDNSKAIEGYKSALEYLPDDAVVHSNLARAWKNVTKPGERLAALDHAISALEKASELEPEDTQYSRDLDLQRQRKAIALHFGERSLEMLPVAAPIAMEVATDLLPYVEGSQKNALSQELVGHLSQLRADIRGRYGVRVPGIRFRHDTDLPNGTYDVQLFDIPVARATLSVEQRLSTTSYAELQSLGVRGLATKDPLTRDDAHWIDKEDWETMEKAGKTLWGVIEYPVRHLESILEDHLSDLIGHQEVQSLLESDPEVSEMPAGPDDLTVLTLVLKRLLDEQVPIVQLAGIVSEFRKLRETGIPLWKIGEAIRSTPEVRPSLPGNSAAYVHYRLGPRYEAMVINFVVSDGQPPVLAMEPERRFDALAVLRKELGPQRNVALVVDNPDARPFVRELIAGEAPRIPVLSRQELLPELENHIAGVVDLE